MKRRMMGWQWHQLDHMHSIYTSLQADNHARTSPLNFFTDRMLFLMPNQQCQSTEKHRKRWDYTGVQYTQQLFYGLLSRTTRVSRYHKKHSPTHPPDHHPIFISFFYLPWSTASSLFKLHAWQSVCTTSLHVLFGLPLGQERSTSYPVRFFTQSVSSFRNTCPHHRNLLCCSTKIIPE